MIRILSVIAALLVLAPVTVKAADSPAVAEVLALNEKLEAAIAAGDAEAISPFFSEDFRLQNSANRVLTGDQVLAQFRSGAIRFTAYDRQIEAAYQSGDVVVLMGEESVQPASGPAVRRRFTSVWRRVDGTWKQIARQSTNIGGAS